MVRLRFQLIYQRIDERNNKKPSELLVSRTINRLLWKKGALNVPLSMFYLRVGDGAPILHKNLCKKL